jgi:hypothetical protein
MNINNIGTPGNVDRTGDRGKGSELKRAEKTPSVVRDDAQISETGRETAAIVEQLAERARTEDGDRDVLVEAARQKLLNGGLDGDAIVAATAEKLADRGFLSA